VEERNKRPAVAANDSEAKRLKVFAIKFSGNELPCFQIPFFENSRGLLSNTLPSTAVRV
jgi:hypothetical protein